MVLFCVLILQSELDHLAQMDLENILVLTGDVCLQCKKRITKAVAVIRTCQ